MKLQIKEAVYNELTISKSKFFSFLFPISSLDETKEKINEFKEKYSDATHVCYAYILDENTFKYYDDGEPSSTAGAPIYQTLKNNNLVYTMCVVVRYFGGTKLGVGGLIKAYTNSCLECLKKAVIVPFENLSAYSIKTSYSNYDKLEYFMRTNNINVISKDFSNDVYIKIAINDQHLELLKDKFNNIIEIKKSSN